MNAAYFLALWLRYDMRYSAIPPEYLAAFLRFAPVYTAVCLAVFFLLRLYNSLWRFASFNELARSLGATAITCVFHWVGMNAFVCRMPVAYYVIGALGQFLMVTAIRFAYRFIRLLSASRRKNARAVHNAMIIGAGAAGQAVLRELKTSEAADAVPRCIIDDDPNKWGRTIDGVPVVGGREVIAETAERYGVDQILIAIPTLSMQERGRLLTLCSETGCQLKDAAGAVPAGQRRGVLEQAAAGGGGGPAGAAAHLRGDGGDLRPDPGQDHPGDRRRRQHRQRAVPSDRGP